MQVEVVVREADHGYQTLTAGDAFELDWKHLSLGMLLVLCPDQE
jgi:hypothetical protein